MKRDVQNRQDVEHFVDEFYRKVVDDEVIGYIFNHVAGFSWEKHIPIMYSFWETVLFGVMSYKGNPMLAHIELHKKVPLNTAHFDRWQMLFFETIDHLFAGEKVEDAKRLVEVMSLLIQHKIKASESKGFIQ